MTMAKSKGPGNVANRPIYSRISYLYQASSYLSSISNHEEQKSPKSEQAAANDGASAEKQPSTFTTSRTNPGQTLSRRLLTDMRAISLKAQIRTSPEVKRTVCKLCDTLLVEGETCTSVLENKSKGGKKPWADVLVVSCKTCGGVKRFPIQARRQMRRPLRKTEVGEEQGDVSMG